MPLESITWREFCLAAASLLLLLVLVIPWPGGELGELCFVPLVDPAGVLQVHCWKVFNTAQLREGWFPLWNPHTGLGQPHLANIQTAVFFPLHLLQVLNASPGWESLLLVLRVWLAALFVYYFARKWRISWPGAAVAAMSYGLGSYALWFMQLIDFNSQMLLPLLMHCLGTLARRLSARSFLAAAAVTALVLLGGHPEAVFITVLLALGFALVVMPKKNAGKAFVLMAGAGVLSLLACMIVLLPFLNYYPRCWHMHGPGFGFFHLELRGLLALLYPGIHHVFADAPERIPIHLLDLGIRGMFAAGYSETSVPGVPPAAGAMVSFLALYAILNLRHAPKMAGFFTGTLAVLLGLTFGLPGFRLLAFIPPFSMFSNFKFYFSEIHFCLAMLAGLAAERLTREAKLDSRVFVAGTTLTLLAAGFGWMMTHGIYTALDWLLPLILVLALALPRLKRRDPSLRAPLSGLLVALFLFLSLFINSRGIVPYLDLGTKGLDQAEWLSQLKERYTKEGPFRITGLEGFFPPNLAMTYGLDDVRSSDALFYLPYVEVINEINGLGHKQALDYFYPSYYTRPSPDRMESPAARPWNIRYAAGTALYQPGSLIDTVLYKRKSSLGPYPPSRQVCRLNHTQKNLSALPNGITEVPLLFQHPPHRLTVSVGETMAGVRLLRIQATLITKDHGASDGVGFAITGNDERTSRLLFSRFISPARDSLELYSPTGRASYHLPLPPLAGLSLITLPGPRNNRDQDWSGWTIVDLDKATRGEQIIPGKGASLYALPADPRFFWTPGQVLQKVLLGKDKRPVEIIAIHPERIVLRADMNQEGYLAMAEMNYPGWRAYLVDHSAEVGLRLIKELPVESDAQRGKAVRLEPGKHTVAFCFVPMDFHVGLFVSLSVILSLPALCLLARPHKARDVIR